MNSLYLCMCRRGSEGGNNLNNIIDRTFINFILVASLMAHNVLKLILPWREKPSVTSSNTTRWVRLLRLLLCVSDQWLVTTAKFFWIVYLKALLNNENLKQPIFIGEIHISTRQPKTRRYYYNILFFRCHFTKKYSIGTIILCYCYYCFLWLVSLKLCPLVCLVFMLKKIT